MRNGISELLNLSEVEVKNKVLEAYNLGLQVATEVLQVYACTKREKALLKDYNRCILQRQIGGRYFVPVDVKYWQRVNAALKAKLSKDKRKSTNGKRRANESLRV